jgi:hypothetical protein
MSRSADASVTETVCPRTVVFCFDGQRVLDFFHFFEYLWRVEIGSAEGSEGVSRPFKVTSSAEISRRFRQEGKEKRDDDTEHDLEGARDTPLL